MSFTQDWITVAVLFVSFFLYFEHLQPFQRQFKLDDPRLQHPFAHVERVTDIQLYLISALIPMAAIGVISATKRFRNIKALHRSVLGLWISLCFAAVITDILKVWIGNPRPDFLARCGAEPLTVGSMYLDITACTSPLGKNRLADGMKSTPSGHSSIAFAGLFYLFLWLHNRDHVGRLHLHLVGLLQVLAVLIPTYIAFSRTQDYRHHFFDVFFGLAIGMAVAALSYFKYHAEPKSAEVVGASGAVL